jgi:hypothetical protein
MVQFLVAVEAFLELAASGLLIMLRCIRGSESRLGRRVAGPERDCQIITAAVAECSITDPVAYGWLSEPGA